MYKLGFTLHRIKTYNIHKTRVLQKKQTDKVQDADASRVCRRQCPTRSPATDADTRRITRKKQHGVQLVRGIRVVVVGFVRSTKPTGGKVDDAASTSQQSHPNYYARIFFIG